MIKQILDELNLENGSKYKMAVLEKYEDNELLKRVLKMTYDKVCYTYGVTMKNVEPQKEHNSIMTLEKALNYIEENFCTRKVTGNEAISRLEDLLRSLSKDDAEILEKIINRDLRLNISKKSINKVFKNLITEFPYMRCSLPSKHLHKIKYPAIVQEKCDGTYRSIVVEDGEVSIFARSGEESHLPKFAQDLKDLPNGVYIGELLVEGMESDRYGANGLINSDTEPDGVYMMAWDYLTLEEWKEGKSETIYKDRLHQLQINIQESPISLVETKFAQNYEEAREFYKSLVQEGKEGTVLKNLDNKFKNGTASDNIKMKEEAVAEFIIIGFQEGEGRLKGTLGALEVKSQDGKVITKVSGFKDDVRKDIWNKREELLNSIVSIKYNGVSKSKGSDVYSLMFAQFDDLRPDKKEADDLKYIQEALK